MIIRLSPHHNQQITRTIAFGCWYDNAEGILRDDNNGLPTIWRAGEHGEKHWERVEATKKDIA